MVCGLGAYVLENVNPQHFLCRLHRQNRRWVYDSELRKNALTIDHKTNVEKYIIKIFLDTNYDSNE